MKKTVIAISLFITSAIFYLVLTITAANLTANTNSWDPMLGRYGSAVTEYGLVVPMIIAYLMLASSVVILFREYSGRPKKEKEEDPWKE